ncbi:MAG: sulfatase family protein, partial [Puniceicoccales bacterium]
MHKPPNVLWIMSDQHHAECWEGGGRPNVRTPHLAELARTGIVYERAYCNNPICGPSRACFLTGQYAGNHGITGNSVQDFQGEADHNLGKHFREAGYETAMIGKAHLPAKWIREGFDHVRLCDLADSEPDDPRSVAYFDYLVRNGLGDAYDLGSLPPEHPGSSMRAFTSDIPLEHSVEVWTGNEGVDFLKNRDPDKPFFVQMSFQRPHDPYSPSPESEGMYNPDELELPGNVNEIWEQHFAGKPAFQREYVENTMRGYPYVPSDVADLKRQLAAYYTLITIIDEQIGRVIAELDKQGIIDETIIVYHADHGDFAGEHGLMLKNMGIYEAIHRIPFILRYPGCQPGRQTGLVESVDLFPTLCALAGLPLPGTLDGKVIAGDNATSSNQVICEWDWGRSPQSRTAAVRTPTHRLVYYRDAPEDGELYHTAEDPEEVHNRYHDDAVRSVRDDLQQRLLNHLLSANRRLDIPHDQAVFHGSRSISKRIQKHFEKWSEVSAELV